uniref:hypothetical protein n=1 Tax=uncultured Bilophila sp. TaxID=529385 RepID=UPI0025EE58D7|nr:hypothetical protein [uncultured Bilophila sp.]
MTDNIHSMKRPQTTEKDTRVIIGKISEDEQITVADTGWSEETKDCMRQPVMMTWT